MRRVMTAALPGLAAGVSMGLTDNIDLDVGYKFRDIMIWGTIRRNTWFPQACASTSIRNRA